VNGVKHKIDIYVQIDAAPGTRRLSILLGEAAWRR